MLLSAAIDVSIFLAIILLGLIIVRLIAGSVSGLMKVACIFPIGASAYSWSLFVVSWAGVRLSVETLLLTYAVLIVVLIGGTRYIAKEKLLSHTTSSARHIFSLGFTRIERITLAFILLVFLVSGLIAIGRSYSSFDAAAIWAPKGYGIASTHSIFGAEKSEHGLAYPLNVPIIIATFKLLSGDPFPSSKLIFPMYYLSLMLGVFAFWRRHKVNAYFSLAGLVVLATVPILFKHSTYGYTNLPLACYLCLAMIVGWEGLKKGDWRLHLLTGILLGSAGWTRLEGVAYAVALAGVLLVAWILYKPLKYYPLGHWLPIIVITGSQAQGRFMRAIGSILSGEYNLGALRLIFGYNRRYLFKLDLWGWLYPINLVLLGLTSLRIFRDKPALDLCLLLSVLVTGLLTAAIFYLGSFGHSDFLGWLTRSFPRELFPSVILLHITSVTATRLR